MTLLGLLGSHASFAADVNLVVQVIALSLLLAGTFFARVAKLRIHSRLMRVAIAIQFGALILWMGPSLLSNIGALKTFGAGQSITILHVSGGVLALVLVIAAAYHRRIGSLELKWTMRTAFLVWAMTAVLGIGFYTYYYLF